MSFNRTVFKDIHNSFKDILKSQKNDERAYGVPFYYLFPIFGYP